MELKDKFDAWAGLEEGDNYVRLSDDNRLVLFGNCYRSKDPPYELTGKVLFDIDKRGNWRFNHSKVVKVIYGIS